MKWFESGFSLPHYCFQYYLQSTIVNSVFIQNTIPAGIYLFKVHNPEQYIKSVQSW